MKTGKIGRIAAKVFLILLSLVFLFTLITYIIHRLRSAKELELLREKGYCHAVSVGDHSLNVAAFGNENGRHTIVSLAGLGMSDYSVTERQMTAALEADDRVVFIDRAGYGLSDDTDQEMTAAFIVEDYRKALKNAGIEAPYILMPHSIGGAYANVWSSSYPDEIEAVVFVDGSQLSENAFDDEPGGTVGFGDHVLAFLAKLGFSRYVLRHNCYLLPDNYSEEEQQLCDALELLTEESIAPVSESCLLAKNAKDAFNGIVTNDIPKLYLCASWGFRTKEEFRDYLEWFNALKEKNRMHTTDIDGISEEKMQEQIEKTEEMRQEILYPYAEKMGNCEVVLLGGDHAIYEQRPAECGVVIKEFIDSLDS
ncbi:MAG: alpha/beta hydrolase [Oscillospiraceae bacterium]|nr:alpha/beta hydrolase [Oscillospiraceae bacterium]